MFEMNRTLDLAMAATMANAAKHGMPQSVRALMMLAEDARNSLNARAHYILGQLMRCLAAHNVALKPETV